MLTWVGKRPQSHITAFPAQHEETFDPVGAGLALPRAQQAAPLQDATIWSDWPADYPKGETTVAVKIIDMLGEEVLVTQMTNTSQAIAAGPKINR
jgi:hypothetical protein